MALDESITLEQGQQQAARRRLEAEQLQSKQRQAQQKVAQKNAQRLKQGVTAVLDPAAAQSLAAQLAYTKGWQYVQEGVEDFAIAFADFMIFSGPAAILIYFIRLVVGTFYSGGPSVSFRNISVPLVPGYSVVEGLYRTLKIIWIALISGAVYAALIFTAYIFVHPQDAVKLALYSVFCWLSSFFGGKC